MAMRTNRSFAVIPLLVVLTAMAFVLSHCGGGGGGADRGSVPGATTPINPGGSPAGITLAARIVDADGLPVQGATVVSGTTTTSTDAAGAVTLPVASAADDGTPVRLSVSRGGYVTGLYTVRVFPSSLNSANTHETTLTLQRLPASLSGATQAYITNADGSTTAVTPIMTTAADSGLAVAQTTAPVAADTRAVTFETASNGPVPPSVSVTIGDASGAGANAAAVLGATGNITGSVVYGDPTDADDLGFFPGEFLTNSDTGAGSGPGALVTAGFARVTLEDAAGTPITSFAPGTAISITMRIPPGVTNPDTGAETALGDTVPVFAFNESTGEWIVETDTDGGVKRATVQQDADGLFVVFAMTHLTWINLDWFGAQCPAGKPVVYFKDAAGNPVSGVNVMTQTGGWGDGRVTYRSETYVDFYRAPRDIPWQVWGVRNGVKSNVATITACRDATLVFNTCDVACTSNTACDDGNINTFDTCTYANTCNASCKHTEVKCDLQLDKVNYVPGDTLTITLTASNAGTEPVYCGVQTALKRDKDNPVWTSFDDDIYITIYPGQQNIARTLTKLIPNDWVGTDTNQGSDYDIYTVRVDRSQWAKGDNFNIHVNKACEIACSSASDCNDSNALTTDTCVAAGTCEAACSNTACTPLCSADSACNDSNALTTDVCTSPGTCSAACTHNTCSVACSSDAACDDGNALTLDACANAGTCSAACTHTACTPACTSNASCVGDRTQIGSCTNAGTCSAVCIFSECPIACTADAGCNDSNALTIDTCSNAGGCDAACVNTACAPVCMANADCNDANALTTDVCVSPNTCSAACSNTACTVVCSSDAACDDSNALTIDTCSDAGLCSAACQNAACSVACSSDAACNDGNPLTTDACTSPGTCSAACSNTACAVACSNDTQCDDSNGLTLDTCNSPGTCASSCSNAACTPVCASGADCDDSNPATLDTCNNAGSCSAYCSNSACSVACSSDATCNDSNPLTTDVCTNPGTCSAVCSNAPCTAACSSDAACNDSNPLTTDVCTNPGTCSAACSNTPCTAACSSDAACDDSNPATTDACNNPGTCSAVCTNTSTSGWVAMGGSASGNGFSNDPGSEIMPVVEMSAYCDPYAVWFSSNGVEMAYVNDFGPSNAVFPRLISSPGTYPDLMLDGTNSGNVFPVVTFVSGSDIFVKEWNYASSTWVPRGMSPTSSWGGAPSHPHFVDDSTYIVWQQDNQIAFARYNSSGGNWIGLADPGQPDIMSGSNSSSPRGILQNGIAPVIVYVDSSGTDSEIYLKRWNGAWQEFVSGTASGGGISNDTVSSFNPDVVPITSTDVIVVWENYGGVGGSTDIRAVRCSVPSGCVDITGNGIGGISNDSVASTTPVVSRISANSIAVAWLNNNQNIYVKQYNFTTGVWSDMGVNSASGGGVSGTGSAYQPALSRRDYSENCSPVLGWTDSSAGNNNTYLKIWIP